MENFSNLNLHNEIIRYLKSEASAADYSAYYGWSGCPCGISRKGGNANIISSFSNGIKIGESLRFLDQWNEDAVAREVRVIANTIIPHSKNHWKFELPILRAVVQLRQLPIKGSLSAKTVADMYGLSVPRAEYVSAIVWDN